MEARLKLTSKIRADKRTKVATDPTLNFEVFSIPQSSDEGFSAYPRLGNSFHAPVFESYPKNLARRLKNFLAEDASALLKIVLSVLICPVTQNAEMAAKFFEQDNRLLKRLFMPYLSATTIDATIIGFRDRDYDVLEEMRHEMELTKSNTHPLYEKHNFDNPDAYDDWRHDRLASLQQKIKTLEKQPPFTGKLVCTVKEARNLDANGERGEPNSSIYFIVKVADSSQRSAQYVADTWDPLFEEEPMTFNVPSKDCRIKIELWDKNFIGSTFLGCVMTKPRELMWLDQPYQKWWTLSSRTRTKDTGITGALLIQFSLSFNVGPYRAQNTSSSQKSAFSSIFGSSSSTSSASSGSAAAPTPSGNHSANHGDAFSESVTLAAPPPIVNSHLNNYPEWFSSLFMICLQDALNHPPTDSKSSQSGDCENTSTASDSDPISRPPSRTAGGGGALSPPIGISSNNLSHAITSSNSNSYGQGAPASFEKMPHPSTPLRSNTHTPIPPGRGTPAYQDKRQSREIEPLLFNLATLDENSTVDSFGNANGGGFTSNAPGSLPRTFSPIMMGETQPQTNLRASSADLLSSSSGSLSRSAPSIRSSTPIKRSKRHSRNVSNNTPEEDATDPVACGPEVHWLLDRFVERFNIDLCLPPLLNMELLSSSFTCKSKAHLDSLHTSYMEFESARSSSPLRWSRVSQLYDFVVCDNLKSLLDEAICNYFTRFPRNEPRGALSQAILLYSTIARLDMSQMSVILHDKLEATMMKLYKVIVGEKITEHSLLDAIKFVAQAVEIDQKCFNDVFPSEVMLLNMSAKTYYIELLSKNVKAWLRTSPPISENTMLIYGFLGKLHSQLSRLNLGIEFMPLPTMFQPFVGKWVDHVGENMPHWCRYDLMRKEGWKSASSLAGSHSSGSILHSPSVQTLFDAFNRVYAHYRQFDMRSAKDLKALVKIFIATITAYMQSMASKIVEIFAIKGAPRNTGSGGGGISGSPGRNSPVMRHVSSARFRTAESGDVLASAARTSSRDLSSHTSSSSSTSGSPRGSSFGSGSFFWSTLGIIPSAISKATSRTSTDRNLFQIPVESCVWISTLETMTHKLYEFVKQISADAERGAEDVRGWFSDTFSQIQQMENQIFSLIIKLVNTNPSLEIALDTMLSCTPDVEKLTDSEVVARLEPLFEYLNTRIDFLSLHLDYKVLLRLLEHIWLLVVKDIEVLAFPMALDRKADAKKAHFVEYALPFLTAYFMGKDNDGLPKEFLDVEAGILKVCFTMLKVPTSVLCKAHLDITNGLQPTGISGSEGIDTLIMEARIISVLSMRKSDKEAKKFVKAHKMNTLNRFTLKAFDLPKGETVVDWFTCRMGKENYVHGYLYVTTNWLCFDTLLWGDQMVTVPLSEIRSLKRKKTTLSTNGITVRLRDGFTTLQFSALNKIKAYDAIVEQAQKVGCVLETYDKNAGHSSGSGGGSGAHGGSKGGDHGDLEDSSSVPSSPAVSSSGSSSARRSGGRRGSVGGKGSASGANGWTDAFFEEALAVEGAKRIENEEDMRNHFGLAKNEEAIAAFDCTLLVESIKEQRSGSSSSATPAVCVMYCFTKSICLRSASHKIILNWGNVQNLGQRGTDGILIVYKERKKSKQYCVAKFIDSDHVFALLHSIWVKTRE